MEKNKTKILIVVALVALAFLIVGATYAYFTAQIGDGKRAEINVTTYTTDVLTFATGDAINLEADQTTFGKDKGSVSGATYASAVLTANNKTNKAVEHYYLYLNIENNTFTYSVQDNKPELIMTITDKDGNEVKNIEGLTYTEVTDRTNKKISGYDITTKSGLVTIFDNREIIAEPKAEDKWNITITFVNYEADQNANTGKVLSAKLMIQKESLSVANICKNDQSLSSCIVAMNGVDDNLYHHDGTLENGINDGSYRYAGEDAYPDLYTCKYRGEDVFNYVGELNKSLKENCDSVSMIYSGDVLYMDKSMNKIIIDKTTVKWDSANNKCLTTGGDDTFNFFGEALPQSLCNGYAYKTIDEEWIGGVKIEELGSGEETLFTSEDKVNQKPALYSCKYNGIDVQNGEGKINSSLKGDCSSLYKITIIKNTIYIDKSIDKAITNKQTVKWDSANNNCVTSIGADVSSADGKIIKNEKNCVGDAYLIGGKWIGDVGIENMGAGEKTQIPGIKNFVCFGSDADACPVDNLYKIIGVIDGKVKLIKYDYANSDLLGIDGDFNQTVNIKEHLSALEFWQQRFIDLYNKTKLGNMTSYYWNNATKTNTWNESNLNKINLNTNFLTNVGKSWADKIAETAWKVGGNTSENIDDVIPSVAYQNEIIKPIEDITYDAKIGLMYASDYGFAAGPSSWTTTLRQYEREKDNNWMYMGPSEFSITRNTDSSYEVFGINYQGENYNYPISVTFDYYVRPTFSLLPSVSYKSGTGTIKDPIRIN